MSATAVAHGATTPTTDEPVIALRDIDVTFRARGGSLFRTSAHSGSLRHSHILHICATCLQTCSMLSSLTLRSTKEQ